MINQLFEKQAARIVEALKKSYRDKDLVATGETIDSISFEIVENGFRIFGADWIRYTETGRGARVSSQETNFLERLERWRRARGVELSAESLRYLINKNGTRLFRGEDPRFSSNRSNVIADVINQKLVDELIEEYVKAQTAKIKSDLLDLLDM